MHSHPCYPFMLEAIRLSRNGFGLTAPNPCVGAVLVRDNQIVASGWHTAYGQPHAERAALADARQKGIDPAGCTMIVTLEPCSHHGKTPPCTEAVLEAGIRHVVIGAMDPNPVAAGGAEFLSNHGINVETGIAGQECEDNIADFLLFQRSARPYLILKLASTLDGRIATRNGHSQWISGQAALERVHWLRSRVQAVMVGGGTFYADDPLLTARLGADSNSAQPLAVVVTSRLPDNFSQFRLLRERPGSTIFFTSHAEAVTTRAGTLREAGVAIYPLEANDAGLNLRQGLEILRQQHKCWYVMCEGGGKLGLSLLQNGLADEFVLHLSPKILGDSEARPLFNGRSPLHMDEAMKMRITGSFPLGEDLCIKLMPK